MDYSCVGIDFEDGYALVSYFNKNEEEPVTVSMVHGSDDFKIPLCVVKKKGIGQWLYGKEALLYSKENDMLCEENLLKRAERNEKVMIEDVEYSLQDLFFFYLKKLLGLPAKICGMQKYDKIAITVEDVNKDNMELFWICMEKLKFSIKDLYVCDHRESFCHYVLHQDETLSRHYSSMYEFEGDKLTVRFLTINIKTAPRLVSVIEESVKYDGMDKDSFLYGVSVENFNGKTVSSVFLTGEGFSGDWMKQSLKYLCSGRRVFLGENLYTKGVCYAPDEDNDYIYLGENEVKSNVSLKVSEHGTYKFVPLAEAGKNWYDQEYEYEILLKGESEIDFWIHDTNENKPKIITYVMNEWPGRTCEFTRVRVNAKPLSPSEIKVSIKDMGFGEISNSTGAISEYIIKLE